MKNKLLNIIGLLISWNVFMGAQNLEVDMNKASEAYKSYDNLSIEWLNYLPEEKDSPEHLYMNKCGEDYFIDGLGQKICINGRQQLVLDENNKIAIYSEAKDNEANPDPLVMIKDVIQSASSIDFKLIGNVKYYQINSKLPSMGTIEIWISQNPWRINKVIQHLQGDVKQGFVFELVTFKAECSGGAKMQISNYVNLIKGTLVLKDPYKLFHLYNAKDYLVKQ